LVCVGRFNPRSFSPRLLSPGSEFLLPVRGFYCRLCKEFYGDAICAEEHVTAHAHNDKYKVGLASAGVAPLV